MTSWVDRGSEILPETPYTPHTEHCSPGMTLGGRNPAAAMNPGDPQEAQEPDSSPGDMNPYPCSWNRLKGWPDAAQDSPQFTGQPVCPQAHKCPHLWDPVHSPSGITYAWAEY